MKKAYQDAPAVIYEFNNRYLCEVRREILPLLKEWRNAQMDVLRQNRLLTDRDQQEWFKRMKNDPSQEIFSLMMPDAGRGMKYIGYCGIVHIDYENQRGEISFLVDPARTRDRSLYRVDFLSALYMLFRFGFERKGLNRLFTETFAFRHFHIKIIEEFGLKKEGRFRKHQFTGGGHCDSVIHSLLREEWESVRRRRHA